MAASLVPPNISQAARQRTGRIRFPPAIREYRIDSEIKSVMGGSRLTQVASNAFVISGCMAIMYSFKLKSVFACGSAVLLKAVISLECFFEAVIEKASEVWVEAQSARIASKPALETFIVFACWLRRDCLFDGFCSQGKFVFT